MIEEKGTISICKDNYKTIEDFWDAVSKQLEILTTNEYEVLFRYDDCGIYTIDYVYDPKTNFGDDRFVLLTEEEEEQLYAARDTEKERASRNDGGGQRYGEWE